MLRTSSGRACYYRSTEENNVARPVTLIDSGQLKALMRMKPSLKDTAAFFGCSEDTVERRIQENFGMSFADFRERNMIECRHSLVRKALQMAESGNVPMLTFALKNLCGWRDRQEEISSGSGTVTVLMSYDPHKRIPARVKPLDDAARETLEPT